MALTKWNVLDWTRTALEKADAAFLMRMTAFLANVQLVADTRHRNPHAASPAAPNWSKEQIEDERWRLMSLVTTRLKDEGDQFTTPLAAFLDDPTLVDTAFGEVRNLDPLLPEANWPFAVACNQGAHTIVHAPSKDARRVTSRAQVSPVIFHAQDTLYNYGDDGQVAETIPATAVEVVAYRGVSPVMVVDGVYHMREFPRLRRLQGPPELRLCDHGRTVVRNVRNRVARIHGRDDARPDKTGWSARETGEVVNATIWKETHDLLTAHVRNSAGGEWIVASFAPSWNGSDPTFAIPPQTTGGTIRIAGLPNHPGYVRVIDMAYGIVLGEIADGSRELLRFSKVPCLDSMSIRCVPTDVVQILSFDRVVRRDGEDFRLGTISSDCSGKAYGNPFEELLDWRVESRSLHLRCAVRHGDVVTVLLPRGRASGTWDAFDLTQAVEIGDNRVALPARRTGDARWRVTDGVTQYGPSLSDINALHARDGQLRFWGADGRRIKYCEIPY